MRLPYAPLSASLIASLLAAALPHSALAAPTWYGANGGFVSNAADKSLTVPDFYQHQNWVSDGKPYVFNPDGSLKSGPTNPTNGWETNASATGGTPAGWCNYTAYADIFYDFYTRGYTTVYPNPTINPVTNPYNALYGASTAAAAVAQSDIFQLRAAMGSTSVGNVQKYLTAQATGLLSNAFFIGDGVAVDGTGAVTTVGTAYYRDPATGGYLTTTLSAFDMTNFLMKHLTADLVYTLYPGAAATTPNANGQGLWWNFHNVAVTGINTASSSVYVADPDSNGGSSTAFAGWPTTNANFPASPPFSLSSAPGAARPVPAAPAVNTPASYNQFYAAFQFGQIPLPPGGIGPPAPLPNNQVGSFDAPQYNRTQLASIADVLPNPIKALIGALKGTLSASLPPVAEQTTVTISLPAATDPIDKIFFEPTSPVLDTSLESDFNSFTIPSDPTSLWSNHSSLLDPFNNPLADGGVEYDLLNSSSPFTAGETALLTIGTLADFSTTGYNLLLHFVGDPSNVWLPEMFGGTNFNPSDTASDQTVLVPEPTSLSLLALGTLLLTPRKQSRRP